MKQIYFSTFLFFLLLSQAAFSQIDTEFWFAAPNVISSHGNSPVYLRLASFDDTARITLDMPANSSFKTRTLTLLPNSASSIELTAYLGAIQTAPADAILNNALHILASSRVAAYYDIANGFNAEIFTLKGRNALGTEFYTPFQSDYRNGTDLFKNPSPESSFDILATEDNTEVTIKPSNDIVGHNAGVPFKIVLNRGQAYSACAVSVAGSGHLMGSHITSNRPIAVSIKDDSVTPGSCYDLIGDQMVPVNLVGTEYIAVKGFLDSNVGDHLYILATQNNTDIFFDGSPTPVATLEAGKQFSSRLSAASKYIKSSQPVYVYHVSGFGCELGSAILPQIVCTGSTDMAFTRASNEYFGLILLTEKGNEGKFKLDNDSTSIRPTSFSEVAGTNGKWVAVSLDLSKLVQVGASTRISNSGGSFNLGIINGGSATAGKYGYFSDFSSLNIGNDRIVCQGDTIKLDAGKRAKSYLWSTGETTQTIKVNKTGSYSVAVDRNNCLLKDTMMLKVNPKPNVELGRDTNICTGSTIKLDAGKGYFKYLWQNQSTQQTFATDTSGKYWARVVDYNNCVNTDTILVTRREYPVFTLKDTVFCGTGQGLMEVKMDQKGTGWWSTPSAQGLNIAQARSLQTSMSSSKDTSYQVFFVGTSEFGCSVKDSLKLGFYPVPTSSFSMDSSKCYGDNVDITYTGNASPLARYDWNFANCVVLRGEKQGPYSVALGAVHEDKVLVLKVTENGCTSDSTLKVLKVSPSFTMGSDTTAGCVPLTIKFSASSNKNGVSYQWNFGDSERSTEQNPVHLFRSAKKYPVSLLITAPNGCQNASAVADMITVHQIPTPDFSLDSLTCYADTIELAYRGNASPLADYQWTLSDIDTISGTGQGPLLLDISRSAQLTLGLRVKENGCQGEARQVKLKRFPHLKIAADVDFGCQPLLVHFSEQSQEPGMVYEWNFGDASNNTATGKSVSHLYAGHGSFALGLTITSPQSCVKTSNIVGKTSVYKKPVAYFTLTPKEAMIDNPSITFENLSQSASGYDWSFGDSAHSSEKDPKHSYNELGNFNVRLIAITENQCRDTAFNKVSIGSFFPPTAFAPNSNIEKNRTFLPVGAGIELQDFRLLVYNRWGNKVFESKDTNKGWDGRINGSDEAASGAYVWTVNYINIQGNEKKYSGTVLLIR